MAHPLLSHARQAIATQLAGRDWRRELPAGETRPSRGCFVSLKLGTQLRGCIGTVLPVRPTLEEEVAENALAAALRDPRFAPLRAHELARVSLSLDLLTPPEPVDSERALDPARYGVLLRSGSRLGVLLPDIPLVRTVRQQIEICLEKAGLSPGVSYTLERFQVERFSE